MISYDVIWNHMIWYDKICSDKTWYDKTWYVKMTYGQRKLFFQNCFGHVGDMFGYHHWSFWAFKKNVKMKILPFSKVVYWPLGYDLASSLLMCSPEINIFEKSKQYFSKLFFRIFIFDFLVFLRINNLKNWPKIA